MFCTYCGKQIADHSKFCPNCGRQLAAKPPVQLGQAANPQPVNPQPANPQPQWQAPAQSNPQPQQWQVPVPPSPQPAASQQWQAPAAPVQKAKGKKKTGLILGLVGLLLALGVGAFFLFGGFGGKGEWVIQESVTYDKDGNVTARITLDEGSTFQERKYSRYDADGKLDQTAEQRLDERGNSLEEIVRNADGSIDSRSVMTYDKDDHVLTRKSYDGEELRRTYEYAYDENGYRTSYRSINSEGVCTTHYEYTNDADGNPLTEKSFDRDGELEYRKEYTYDKDGNTTLEVKYDGDGSLRSSTAYTYDDHGSLTREEETYGSSVWVTTYKNDYDAKGRLLRAEEFDEDGESQGWEEYAYPDDSGAYTVKIYDEDGLLDEENVYDKDGNRTSHTSYNSDGSVDYHSERRYDDDGHLLEEKLSSSWYVMEYDGNGNKVKQTEKDVKTGEVVEWTEITYKKF